MENKEYTIEDFLSYAAAKWSSEPVEVIDALKIPIERYNIEDTNLMKCYYYLGLAFFQNEEYNVAVPAFNRALELASKNNVDVDIIVADCHFFLGMSYDRIDMVREAIASYKESAKLFMKIEPENLNDLLINICYYIGSGYLMLDKDEEVIKYFTKALELVGVENQEDYELILSECYMYIGVAYANLKEYNDAIPYLETAIKYFEREDKDSLLARENVFYTLSESYAGIGKVLMAHKYKKMAKELTDHNKKYFS